MEQLQNQRTAHDHDGHEHGPTCGDYCLQLCGERVVFQKGKKKNKASSKIASTSSAAAGFVNCASD
ncbi:hypothetical protein NMG60_11029544 [Bertholletia excelsa]